MKRLLMGLLGMMACMWAVADETKVALAGRVIETETKEPVVQATVQLLSLPDSAFVAGIATDGQGRFVLPEVKVGSYVLKLSYVGFRTKAMPIEVSPAKRNLGTLTLDPDAVALKEAVITAEAPQVVVKADTLEFNSAAYRTSEGAMLEELVKKLPGAEVNSDGNITINGKEIKKIMVEGKEFFGGDVATGLKNLPVNMIDKLKTYDRKSDLARITGIDDGEEETVLDLKVKKGMNQGWFGNADVAAGTQDRYAANLMVNRFVESKQFSLIASSNNVNDQNFSSTGAGGRPRFGGGNYGLTDKKNVGLNFATESPKLELGGSARYDYTDNKVDMLSYSERFLQQGNVYTGSSSATGNRSIGFYADFRLEWKPDSLTNIIFRPDFSLSRNRSQEQSLSGTFSQDPLNLVTDWRSFIDGTSLAASDDPLREARVNGATSDRLSRTGSLSANASLQLNRKLDARGRNLTLRLAAGYGSSDSDSYISSLTRYYLLRSTLDSGQDSLLHRRQFIGSPGGSHNYSAQLTYSEPIARNTFLQLSYKYQRRFTDSDRGTYDLNPFADWSVGAPLPVGYDTHRVDSLSKLATYRYNNHEIMAGLRWNTKQAQISAGLTLQPQHTSLDYRMGAVDTVVHRSVVNFSPNVDVRIRFSQSSHLRMSYRGNASLPGMENLIPNPDTSNPLNIRMGNPGLKPSFTHQLRGFYNTYNAELQRGIMTHINVALTQNSIGNVTRYNATNGGLITQPENIDGNWRAFGAIGYNTALKDRRFTVNTFSRGSFNNTVSYLYNETTRSNDRNVGTQLTLGEHLSLGFRNDWLELTLNGSLEYTDERNKLRPVNNQKPYTYGYGVATNITLPWGTTLSSNITNNVRRGYRDASMNRNELVWNAQVAHSFLKGRAATLSLELYDILRRQTNISRTLTADLRSVAEYNGITNYAMLRFAYQFNAFGSKETRKQLQGPGAFDPGPGPGRPNRPEGGGGFGGRRPF